MAAGSTGSRVVVTGLGVVSSIGTGIAEFAQSLRDGRSGVTPITAFDTNGFEYANGCEVPDFRPEMWIGAQDPQGMGRAAQLAVAGTRLALADAGLPVAELRARPSVVSIGTTSGELGELEMVARRHAMDGEVEIDPGTAGRARSSRLSTDVARELALSRSEVVTVPTACAAGNYAIGYGFDAIAGGDVDVALCGGVDAMARTHHVGFYRLGTIAPRVCAPFDRHRQGILVGEGSGVLVLESLDAALARGATIRAEVLGYGLSCDSRHPVSPDRDGVAESMSRAHANAGVAPGQVDLISAHGTGTVANDRTEVSAIRQVFGDRPPPTVATKSMLGHTMGAASALGAIACVVALTEGFIPPTVNFTEADPEVDIDCVPNQARPASLRVVQNNALAFGGNNAVLILGSYT